MSSGQSKPKVYCGPWGPRMVLRYRRLPAEAESRRLGDLANDEPLSDAVGHIVDRTSDGSVMLLPDAGPVLEVPREQVVSLTSAGHLRMPPVSKAGRVRRQKRLRYAAGSAMWRLDGWWALQVVDLDLHWIAPTERPSLVDGADSPADGEESCGDGRELLRRVFEGAGQVSAPVCPITPDDWVIVRVGAVSGSPDQAVEMLMEALPGTPRWIIGADTVEFDGDWCKWVSSPWHNHLMIR